MPKVLFGNTGQIFEITEGCGLLEMFISHPELPLKFGCTHGECGVCAIKIIKGHENLSKCTKQEIATLKQGGKSKDSYRLACQCSILGDVEIE